MKKLLFVAFVTLAASSLTPKQAAALWPFSNCSCCCDKHMTIHCRQYNAFSPWCCETACFSCGHGGPNGTVPLNGSGGYPMEGPGGTCGPNGCGDGMIAQDGVYGGDGPITEGTVTDPSPSTTAPPNAPMPIPAPKAPAANPGPTSQMWPGMAPYGIAPYAMAPYGAAPYGMVQQAGYRPYYPGYNPGYAPQYNRGYGYPNGYGYAPQYSPGYAPQYNPGYAPPYNMGYAPQYGAANMPWYWNGGR